jgi:hypothetical protein
MRARTAGSERYLAGTGGPVVARYGPRTTRGDGQVRRLGRIVRLQVQVAPLKHGERPDRGYDTGRIRRVSSLEVTAHGVIGHADDAPGPIVDVHHRDHPESRYRGDNGISLLTTGHYALMRERFGPHVHDGIAAESVLVERPGWLDLRDLAGGVAIVPDDGAASRAGDGAASRPGDGTGDADALLLGGAGAAQPCVEFSRLVSGAASGSLREPLAQLRDGMRGYYLQVEVGAGTVLHEGDWVLARDGA